MPNHHVLSCRKCACERRTGRRLRRVSAETHCHRRSILGRRLVAVFNAKSLTLNNEVIVANPKKEAPMHQLRISSILAALVGLSSIAHAASPPVCKPILAFTSARFSPMQPPTLERRWTALLSVDASRCTTRSGAFTIGFARLKENALDADFRLPFTWHSNAVDVSVDFWADEAVQRYWLDSIAPCPCRN